MARRKPEPGPIWTRPEPGSRRPSFSREEIAQTALRIADTEGYEAVSMRRIARELGAGTMTLYHYVRNKNDLIALISDAIMQEILIPDGELPDGWREGMTEIARRTKSIFERHAWILDHFSEGDDDHTGPSTLRHIEQTLEVASRTGLDLVGQLEISALVDDYVFGHVARERADVRVDDETGADRRLESVRQFLDEHLADEPLPRVRAAFAAGPPEDVGRLAGDPHRFDRGLETLLDGIELQLQKRRG